MKQKIEVTWRMSVPARKRALIETGEEPSENQRFTVDLADLTPEQRKPIVERLFPNSYPRIEASEIYEFDPDVRRDYLNRATVKYDEQPSIDEVCAIAERQVEEMAKAEAYKEQVKAQEKAEEQRKTKIYERMLPIVNEIIDADDYEALNTLFQDHPEAAEISGFKPGPGADSLSRMVTKAMRKIRKSRWQAQMEAWVMEHGSQHLRDCILQGYHCERLYVKERAAQEFPGWTVDFYRESDYKERTNPTHQALQLERDLMDEHNVDVEIVWLVNPAQDTPTDDYYHHEPFEACEALVIHNYLDKYDLVREIVEF